MLTCLCSLLYNCLNGGVGWSWIGIWLQEGEHCPLSGAVSLCNPFDLVAADKDFHKGFNNLYDKALARGLRKNIKKYVFQDASSCWD